MAELTVWHGGGALSPSHGVGFAERKRRLMTRVDCDGPRSDPSATRTPSHRRTPKVIGPWGEDIDL
jgi:hypothetical protein